MTPRDPRAIEAKVRAEGIPDEYNRWIGMTVEAMEANEKALKRIVVEFRERKLKNPRRRARASASGLGVPLGFLQRHGAKPAITTKGDDTMKKIKTKATRKAATRKKPASVNIKDLHKSEHPKAKANAASWEKKNGGPVKAPKAAAGAKKPSKADDLATLLRKPGGATSTAICAEFGWLPHSARAAISGLKKVVKDGGRGLDVKATKNDDGVTVYSIG